MNQILEKISKTLKLANNNKNINEAQSAILAAQRIMAKYHVTQEEIENFINNEEINSDKEDKVIEENAENETNNDKWKRNLMIMIAKNFRCDVYYRGGRLIIVGNKDDIVISKRIYLYAKQVILNGFKEFFKENYETCIISNSIRNKYKREYALGFIKGLSEKFEKQKADSELSLVVVNPNVKDYLSSIKFTGVHRTKSCYITDNYCYEEGRKNGKNLMDIDTKMKGAC